jgi:hypothetical protein
MAKRSNPARLIMALGAALFVAAIGYFTYQQTGKQYEVCITFKGATHCSTARGASKDEAIRSARDIDCANLTNGRDELMVCSETPAASVREIQ